MRWGDRVVLRPGTLDEGIWWSVRDDYRATPTRFEPGEVVVDIGCHTGAFSQLAAGRGARVVGYEANRENHALAVINLAGWESVTLHQEAVWRSDVAAGPLYFTPSPDAVNTGGGSVLFSSAAAHRRALARSGPARTVSDAAVSDAAASEHAVPAVGLDTVLAASGPVRLLKIDVEGAEYPILLTATRLDLVAEIVGEYHDFTDEQMVAMRPEARVGEDRYCGEGLREWLTGAGFQVTCRSTGERLGLFHAVR